LPAVVGIWRGLKLKRKTNVSTESNGKRAADFVA
jgi:hypothetical protein